MSYFVRLLLSLLKRIKNGWSHLNRWAEEQQLVEIELFVSKREPPGE